MIMRTLKYILLTVVFAFFAVSCEDGYNDDIDESKTDYVSNDPLHPATDLDNWLMENFTYPYNIEVKYRWDASEGDIFRTLVPPKVSQIQPVMDVVKDVWIDPYGELAGGTFIKTFCPKQFLLIGSARYNIDGTFTLGTAEGGRKVVLYVVNEFVASERPALENMMHIVHHEFAHILNQKVPYPAAFREVTAGTYTGDWRFFSVGQARVSGFITNYAMASPDEDFAEMVATMLMQGKDGYEAILECQATQASRETLRKKEQLVLQYYRDAFDIDFYALQAKVQEALNTIAPPPPPPVELPPLFDQWGFGMEKTAVRFDLSTMNEPAEFAGRYHHDNTVMHDAGLALDYNFKLYFTSPDELTLRVYYYELASEPRVYREANFYYWMERPDNGTVNLYLTYGDDNALYLANDLNAGAVAGFFGNRNFQIDWLQSCTGQVYVGFWPTDDPENYCFGVLEN